MALCKSPARRYATTMIRQRFECTPFMMQHNNDHQSNSNILDNKCLGSFRYKNIMANRSVPILFVLVCFLVIANSNCDNVGSTNAASGDGGRRVGAISKRSGESSKELSGTQNDGDLDGTASQIDPSEQQAAVAMHITSSSTSAPTKSKYNALNVLKEIYLDSNSKVTMFLPDETVQKFHPNGRYGRRSVDNFAEQHNEFGKLISDDQSDSSRASGLPPMRGYVAANEGSLGTLLRLIGHNLNQIERAQSQLNASSESGNNSNSNRQLRQELVQALALAAAASNHNNDEYEQVGPLENEVARNQLEPNKLLKCTYLGLLNLYKCHSAGVQRVK